MYGDEFKCIFSAFEWNELLRMFANEVKAKRYEKLKYESWRELRDLSESMETWEDQVRVYWTSDYDHYSLISVYIDSKANGKPDMPFEFDSGDSSFGSFLYELELYREEKAQMKVKDRYFNSDECQTYDDSYHSKDYYLSPDELKSYGLGVSYLDDRADVVCDTLATKADVTSLNRIEDKVNTLAAEVAAASPMKNCVSDPYNNTINNKKENTAMKFNFDFGPVNASLVHLSMYGLAVKNKAGTWVSYDATSGDIMDVDALNFVEGSKFLYRMPVAIKDIAVGDVIIHHGAPMFVVAIASSGAYVTAVDPIAGERKDVMLTKSPFGFNFVTKVVNFLGNLGATASSDNPFGNLGLMLMLSDNKDMGDLLPLMLMSGNSGLDMSNPLMLYALMGNDSKGGNDNILPMLMMLNAQHPVTAAPAHTCACGGHCGENHTQG